MDFSEFFEHAVTAEAVDSGRDTGGGTALTFTTRDTDIPCLLAVSAGGESTTFDQQQLSNDAELKTYYQGFERGDRVTVTAGPGQVGSVFRVVGIGTQPGLGLVDIGAIVTVKLTGWQ